MSKSMGFEERPAGVEKVSSLSQKQPKQYGFLVVESQEWRPIP